MSLIPDRDLMTEQSTNSAKVQLGQPMIFNGVIYRNMGEGLFTGTERSQRQLHHQSLSQRG